eukprot:868468-Pleurochrysis_carterae.AAC.1
MEKARACMHSLECMHAHNKHAHLAHNTHAGERDTKVRARTRNSADIFPNLAQSSPSCIAPHARAPAPLPSLSPNCALMHNPSRRSSRSTEKRCRSALAFRQADQQVPKHRCQPRHHSRPSPAHLPGP